MFANLIHEAFCFVNALQEGQVSRNANSGAVDWKCSERLVASSFFGNDVGMKFKAAMRSFLQVPDIMRAYRLCTDRDYNERWICGTVDSLVRITVLLTQPKVVPHVPQQADRYGRYEDHGCYSVVDSRKRCACSYHDTGESFDDNVSSARRVFMREVNSAGQIGGAVIGGAWRKTIRRLFKGEMCETVPPSRMDVRRR